MANVQIYQLDNAGSDLDNSALLAMDIPNPDASAASEIPYVTRKESIASLETQMLQTDEYTTALDTTSKSIVGAINEHHSVIGYNYDAYDNTSTYSVGDLCIYNNALYKCTTAITTAEAWNASHWTATSIADEISTKADASTTYTKSEVDNIITSDISLMRVTRLMGNSATFSFTHPQVEVSSSLRRPVFIIGYNLFTSFVIAGNAANAEAIINMGSNTITVTKSVDSYTMNITLSQTSWGGVRIITFD